MTPKRVIFKLLPKDADSLRLVELFGNEIENHILEFGDSDSESFKEGPTGTGFLTSLPKPKIGRVMASWYFQDSETAIVIGLLTGDKSFETPPDGKH